MYVATYAVIQVSLPHYRSSHFLTNAVTRYKKFLHLKRVASDVFLVPCYDFDLVWHAHQLHPVDYKRDTTRVIGRLFNHDDTVNDRTPGSKLSESDAQTRQLWKDNYKVRFLLHLPRPSYLVLYCSSFKSASQVFFYLLGCIECMRCRPATDDRVVCRSVCHATQLGFTVQKTAERINVLVGVNIFVVQ